MSYLDGTFNARDVLILVVVAVRDDPLETDRGENFAAS